MGPDGVLHHVKAGLPIRSSHGVVSVFGCLTILPPVGLFVLPQNGKGPPWGPSLGVVLLWSYL